MFFRKFKRFEFDSKTHAQNAIVSVQDMLLNQGFCAISDNTYKRKWKISISHNSFSPIVGLVLSDMSVIVKFSLSRSTLFIFRCMNICLFLFLVMVFLVALSEADKWYYCTIPLGMLIYSHVLSKVMFDLSVRRICALLEESLNHSTDDLHELS